MNPYLLFILGSLVGSVLTFLIVSLWVARLNYRIDELVAIRETIRRNAYARGFEDAKSGNLKRS